MSLGFHCVSVALTGFDKNRLIMTSHLTFTFLMLSEYQTDSQPLRPCELQREKAFTGGETYIPQCSEDGQFR